MHRQFQPRGYYDRDRGGGSGHQQQWDFNSPHPPRCPPGNEFPESRNYRPRHPPPLHQMHQGPGGHFRARGQGLPFRPRGHPGRGGPPFRGRGFNSQQGQSNGGVRPRGQQPFTPRQQWNPNHSNEQRPEQGGPEKPWITPDLMRMIQDRNELWDIYNQDQTEASYRLFKVKRIQVNMACNDAKILYQQQNPYEAVTAYTPYARASKPMFYCDPCDRKLISKEALEEHNAEHITCKLDGCTYTAHVKLVMKHIELQHSNNLYHRIKGYDTPEEIEKWKEERRQNFPTPENIMKKKAERLEMRERGETMGLKNEVEEEVFRYKIVPEKRSRNSMCRPGAEYQSDGEDDVEPRKKLKRAEIEEKSRSVFSTQNTSPIVKLLNFYTDIEVTKHGKLIGSTRDTWIPQDDEEESLKNFNNEDNEDKTEFNITDDEDDECIFTGQSKIIMDLPRVEPVIPANSIAFTPVSTLTNGSSTSEELTNQSTNDQKSSSLLGLLNYDSDSDGVDEEINTGVGIDSFEDVEKLESSQLKSTATTKLNIHPTQAEGISAPSSDEEGPDELATRVCKSLPLENESKISESVPPKPEKSIKKIRKKVVKPQTVHASIRPLPKRYTLLERLLAPDIRHERNVILQACRYIVDKNFFEKPSEQSSCDIEKDFENEKSKELSEAENN